jgi:hypothetical protein
LDTKWRSIKYDISISQRIHVDVKALNEREEMMRISFVLFEVYQLEHLRGLDFGFEHYWHIGAMLVGASE